MEPIIKVEHLKKTFQTGAGEVAAVDDISFSIDKGDIYGIIGLSGAGKSTLVRCHLGKGVHREKESSRSFRGRAAQDAAEDRDDFPAF